MFRKLGIGFAALAMLAPGFASALGVGDYTLKSYLNQPLKMEVELTDARDLAAEEVLVSLAAQKEFDAAGVERVYFLSDLNFEVELDGEGGGTLIITSVQPVREPFLNFLVEFLWPNGRLLREYTVLVDPPSYDGASVEADTAAPVQQAPAAEPAAQPQSVVVQESTSTPAQTSAPRPVAQSSRPIQVVDRAEYVVQTDDTMWRIALNNRPAQSISVQQMLIAIQTLNQDAFIDGNVNLVREGTVLRMPTEEEVRQISTREALSEVAEQNRQWRAKLEARGIRVPTRPQVDGSRRSVDRSTSSTQAPTEGEVTLVAPDATEGATGAASGGGDAKALQNEIAIREERVDQLARENKELSSRLADLNQQVETSEQLLQLRNDQIAQLQQQLRKLQEEQGIAPTEPVQVAPVKPVEPVAPTSADAAQTDVAPAGETATPPAGEESVDGAETEVAAAEGAADGATGADEAAAPAGGDTTTTTATEDAGEAAAAPAKPAVTPAPAPAPVPQPSFIEQNMQLLMIAGVVVLVAVLGALAFFARRRKAAAAEAYSDEYDSYAEDDEDFLAPDSGDDEMDLDAFAEGEGDDAAPGDAGQDPMEEVDVYTAYGRHAEAVTFLRNEINKAPERSDLKVRLLEVLVEMRDADAFQADADKFAGDAAVAARLPDMREQLGLGGGDDAGLEFDDIGSAGDQDDEPSLDDLELDLAADMDTRKAPAEDAPLDFDMGDDAGDDASDATLVLDAGDADDSFELDMDLDTTGAGDAVDAPASEDDNTISFDMGDSDELSLDLDDDADEAAPEVDADKLREVEEAMNVEPALELGDTSDAGDELLELDDIEVADASDEFNEAAQQPSSEDIDLSLDDLDLDAAMGDESAPAAAAEEELSLEADDLELSLEGDDDLSLSLDDTEEATEVGIAAVEPEATVQRESLDDIAATDVRAAVDSPAPDLGAGDDDDFEFLGDADENATKLDLAKAYIDMGDAEGARDILNEVLAEGSDQQQAEAKELLAQVG